MEFALNFLLENGDADLSAPISAHEMVCQIDSFSSHRIISCMCMCDVSIWRIIPVLPVL